MQRLTLDFAVGTGLSATCLRVIGRIDGRDVALSILVAGVFFVTFDDIGVLQTHLLAWSQTLELLLSHLHEVVTFNPQFPTESDGMLTVCLILRIVHGLHLLGLTLGIVGQN